MDTNGPLKLVQRSFTTDEPLTFPGESFVFTTDSQSTSLRSLQNLCWS